MKKKTKIIIQSIILGLIQVFFLIAIVLTFSAFFLVFINANIEYFQELPPSLIFAIPIGYVGVIIWILGLYPISPIKSKEKK